MTKQRQALGILVLLITVFISFGCGGGGGGGGGNNTCDVNFSGVWNATETIDGCDEPVVTRPVTYTITQNGCSATISSSIYGSFNGTVEGSVLSGTLTFPDEGGNITADFTFTRNGDNLYGTGDWTWTGSGGSCGGTIDITGTLTPEPTSCIDVSGTWAISENYDLSSCPGDLAVTGNMDYDYDISQTGCNIIIDSGYATGTVTGNTITAQGVAEYEELDITLTEDFTGTVDGNSLSGNSVYTVTDFNTGVFVCSGTSTYTGTRITGTATAFGTRAAIIKKFPFPNVNR
jgi:hypothetical protein